MIKHYTDRLIIRYANYDDSQFIYSLLNSPSWIKHIGNRQINQDSDARKYIRESLLESYSKNGFGMYIVENRKDNVAMGLCGFLKRDVLDSVDIGFAILPEFTKKGYTFEAANKIIAEAKFPKIYGITSVGNIPSRKLLKKLGMKHLKNFQFGDYDEDSMLFGMELGQ